MDSYDEFNKKFLKELSKLKIKPTYSYNHSFWEGTLYVVGIITTGIVIFFIYAILFGFAFGIGYQMVLRLLGA